MSALKQNIINFTIDHFLDNYHSKINYPNHCVVIGATQSGKSSLIAKIFDSIQNVYCFNKVLNGKKKLVIISPMPELEIYNLMKSKNDWVMTLYSSQNFSQHLITEIKKDFSQSNADINILLIDDFVIQAAKKPKYLAILNEIYAYFRHMNISIFSTLHSYDRVFQDLIQQAAMIICMNTPYLVSVLRSVLRPHFYLGTASVVRGLVDVYIKDMSIHDYLVIFNTKESMAGDIFYISDSCFNPKFGLTSKQFLNI